MLNLIRRVVVTLTGYFARVIRRRRRLFAQGLENAAEKSASRSFDFIKSSFIARK